MTGKFHSFSPIEDGGYDLSLYYPKNQKQFRGKTSDSEDRIRVRFVELNPPHRIVQSAVFVTSDPSFSRQMRMVIHLQPKREVTVVTMTHENLPSGLKPEDDEKGSKMSLDQLANYLEKSSTRSK